MHHRIKSKNHLLVFKNPAWTASLGKHKMVILLCLEVPRWVTLFLGRTAGSAGKKKHRKLPSIGLFLYRSSPGESRQTNAKSTYNKSKKTKNQKRQNVLQAQKFETLLVTIRGDWKLPWYFTSVIVFKVPPFCDWQTSGRRQGGECLARGVHTTTKTTTTTTTTSQ